MSADEANDVNHVNETNDANNEQPEKSPAEQLLELFVYAPVGLLYDGEKVLDQLVTKGKSQVQLMKLMGQMAANKSKAEADDAVGDAFTDAALAMAKGLADFGAATGLFTPSEDVTETNAAPQTDRNIEIVIADYDDLTAREIIAQLSNLDRSHLGAIRDHETANRGRKTVLAKIDQLS